LIGVSNSKANLSLLAIFSQFVEPMREWVIPSTQEYVMTTSSPSFPGQGAHRHGISGWVRSFTFRRIGSLVLLLALLMTIASALLQAELNYPAFLLNTASSANSLIAQRGLVILLGFVSLLLAGGLLMLISLGLTSNLDEKSRRRVLLSGGGSGVCWMLGALCGMTLVPMWGNAPVPLTQTLATLTLVMAEIIAPFGLSLWTLALAQRFRAHRVLGWLSAIGLLLEPVRSLFWGLNALLPTEGRGYGTVGVLSVLALLGTSCWLVWLLLFGFRLLTKPAPAMMPASSTSKTNNAQIRVKRRRFVKSVAGLGVALAGVAFVGVRTGLTVTNAPDSTGDGIPAEPSFLATLYFLAQWILFRFIYPIRTVAQLLSLMPSSSAPPPPPPGVTVEQVDADGVPAQRILVTGAGNQRWILHFHPGGFTRAGVNDNRAVAVRLAQAAGSNALFPDYRGTPAHPFPAGLNDCVTAYRWLRGRGVAASQIAITGESAGANLVLATALALRESGEALPGALIAASPPTDMAMTGESMKTKAFIDPLMAGGLAQDAFALYTNHEATDPRNPLVSPLYANVQGLPPTLLLAGTEEALLSDSTRMADRLKAGGVEVKLEIWPGMWHDFIGSPDVIPEVRLAMQHIANFIRQHVGA
jgi:acetyl esterase/lipase